MRRVYFGILLILLVSFTSGCSSNFSPIEPSNSQSEAISPEINSDTHYLWGYWTLLINREKKTIEAIPHRSTQMHVNVVGFLEKGVLHIAFANLIIDVDLIELDVKLTHPFPGLSTYTGFDVRGIFITPGTVAGYSDPGIIHASPSETYLMNADGWTRWWNPTEFPVGKTLFNYINGKLGVPYNGSNLNATLNAYKYFCDDLDPNEPLSGLILSHRGIFSQGATNTRHYTIHFVPKEPLIYNYAVDASWALPSPNPPIAVPADFPPDASAPEAYRIETRIVSNELFFMDSENKGGKALVEVDVYDWWGCDSTSVTFEVPGTYVLNAGPPVGGNSNMSTWQFELDGNLLNSSKTLEALIIATSADATYTLGDLADKHVATYSFMSIPISSVAKAPKVYSIDPNNDFINTTVTGAKVSGADFASNAQVTLIKNDNPSIEIHALNEIVSGGNTIVCDIPLTGPSVVPGKYDVRVTNPTPNLYGEFKNGFTVNDLAHPWPGWMAAGKNQAASKYVGYGNAGADPNPKWVFSPTGYSSGGPTAGCAIANDGTIYFNSTRLHAVGPDGIEKWTFQLAGACWSSVCPAIDLEGYVYTCLGTPSVNYLYKIDPKTKTAVWSCNIGSAPCYPGAPAIGKDGAVYVFTGSISQSAVLRRVNPDGTPGWSVSLGPFAYSYSWQLGTAVLDNGNIVCSGGSTGKIFCFQPNGTLVWEYQYTSWTLGTPCVGPNGNVYFTTWGGYSLVALNSSGSFLWSYNTGFYLWANPVVDPATGRIFFGDRNGKFRCFNPDGSVVWTRDFGASRIDGTAAVDANGDVYVAVGNQPTQPFKGLVKMKGSTGDIIWQSIDIGYMITTAPSIGADGSIYLPGYDSAHMLYKWGY